MAVKSLALTYLSLKKSGSWLNAVEIAADNQLSTRSVLVHANALVKEGLAVIKTVDRRKFFKLTPDQPDQHPVIIDINETSEIRNR